MVLASAGFVLTIRDWRRLSIWYALVIVLIAAIVGFFILGRYRFPLVALCIPFAAVGITNFIDAILQRSWRAVGVASIAALLTAIVCHLPVHDTETLNSSSFSNLGAAAAENGDMEKAINLFQRAARESPSMPEVHVNLGRAMMATGEIENAIGELRLALSLQPNLVDADYFLGRAYELVGDKQSAVLHYRRAVAIDPENQAAAASAARLGG
jgi:tetratricopeptide (TPR) repeat protein